MRLNCDLGESYGAWQMGADEAVMPLIDQANIACGVHAGDPIVMQRTIAMALEHNVQIGAHPSYPDRQGFGRRSMALSEQELIAWLHYQLSTLDGMAKVQGGKLVYVKPHGALYNDMMRDEALRHLIYKAMAQYDMSLSLMVLAGPNGQTLRDEAKQFGLSLLFEAFADRHYAASGDLMPRQIEGAVLSHSDALRQASQLIEHQTVTTASGAVIAVQADSLCVHGDNPEALALLKDIRALMT